MHQLFKKPETLLLAVSLIVAVVLRFWNLPDTVQFLGDQGRDALIVSRIFREGDLVFIGPVTSVGNMYLGPLYYYLMLPWLWLSYPSPLGPVYAVAALGVLTVGLMYILGKDLVGKRAALYGAMLLATSTVAVEYSRFSWNPNPTPFVSLIMVWALFKASQGKNKYWVVVAAAFSVLIQLHYLTLLAGAAAGLIWLIQLVSIIKNRSNSLKAFLGFTFVGGMIFITSLIPLILFDLKHQGLNSRAFIEIFTEEESFGKANLSLTKRALTTINLAHERSLQILFDIYLGKQVWANSVLLVSFLGGLAWLFKNRPSLIKSSPGLVVLLLYVFVGIAGTTAYSHSVFNHYIAYLFPPVLLIHGWLLDQLSTNRWGRLSALSLGAAFLAYNFTHYGLTPIGWRIIDIQRAADAIYERVEPGEKYNIVLLSGTGDIDGQNYRYFLESKENPPLGPDRREELDALFIIDEERKVPRVVELGHHEIVVFPSKYPSVVFGTPGGGPEVTVLRKSP